MVRSWILISVNIAERLDVANCILIGPDLGTGNTLEALAAI